MIWSRLRSGYDFQVCEYLSTPEKVWVKVCSLFWALSGLPAYKQGQGSPLLPGTIPCSWSPFEMTLRGSTPRVIASFLLGTSMSVLGFRSHSHVCNNNGGLLIRFSQSLCQSCLNTIPWGNLTRESPTFCCDFGEGFVELILDYGLVSSFFLPQDVDFWVHSEVDQEMDSAHASLLIAVSLSREVLQPVPLRQCHLG